MKSLFVITMLSLFSFSGVQAQWKQVNSNTKADIVDMVFTDPKTGYFVSGDKIYQSTDAGENWSEIFQVDNIRFTGIIATTYKLYVFGLIDNKKSMVYSTLTGANDWKSSRINYEPAQVQSQRTFTGYFTDRNDNFKLKYFAGNVNTLFNGSTSVYGVRKNEVVTLNLTVDTIFKSEDYGQTWSALADFPKGFGPTRASYAQIKSFGDTIVVSAWYGTEFHISEDNGNSWKTFRDEEAPITNIILNSGTIYGMTYCEDKNGNRVTCLARSIDFGKNFKIVQTGLKGKVLTYKFYSFSNDLMFAFANNGVIYKTTNGGGLSVNKNQKAANQIKVYPNPGNEKLYIDSKNPALEKLMLYNLQGRLVKSKKIRANDSPFILKLSDVERGQYLLKINTGGNGQSITKKIIVN